jgi:tetratricopeptide (TPR) repeat protein
LFYRSGQSIHEIAAATESTEDAVKQKLHRARQSLKTKLEEMIGDVLTTTAPGEAFTLGVMAAVSATILTQTAAAAVTAAGMTVGGTKTAVGTGSAAAGYTIGFVAFLKIFGALGWFVWMFALAFFTQWTLVQNIPTLRARRFRVHTFFLFCQYANLLIIGIGVLGGLGVLALTIVLGGNFTLTRFPIIITPLAFLMGIGIHNRLLNRNKQIIESDLGLREHVKSYSYRQIEQRFYRSFIPNIFIIETICGAGLIIPLLDGPRSAIPALSTLGVTGLLSLILYTYYIFGINFMKLCRSNKSMIEYPPLLDDPFEVALFRKFKNPASIDHNHWRRAGRLNYFQYFTWIGMGGCLLFFLCCVNWSNHPILTAVGMSAIPLGVFIGSYFNKRTVSLKNIHLSIVFLSIYNVGCILFLANLHRGSETLQEYLQGAFMSGQEPFFQNMIVFFLVIYVAAGIYSFVQWIRTKPEAKVLGNLNFFETDTDKYDTERLREAVAVYKPTDTEDEPEIPAFPKRKWFWICFLYGVLFLLAFAVLSLIPNPYAERTILEQNHNYSKLIELYPDNPDYYIGRSGQQNTLELKLTDLDKAIQLKPEYARAYEVRASVRSNAAHDGSILQSENAKELYRLALIDADEAVRLDPKLKNAWIIRSIIHYDGFNDYDAAIADCDEVIRIEPKSSWGYTTRAWYHALHGNFLFWEK